MREEREQRDSKRRETYCDFLRLVVSLSPACLSLRRRLGIRRKHEIEASFVLSELISSERSSSEGRGRKRGDEDIFLGSKLKSDHAGRRSNLEPNGSLLRSRFGLSRSFRQVQDASEWRLRDFFLEEDVVKQLVSRVLSAAPELDDTTEQTETSEQRYVWNFLKDVPPQRGDKKGKRRDASRDASSTFSSELAFQQGRHSISELQLQLSADSRSGREKRVFQELKPEKWERNEKKNNDVQFWSPPSPRSFDR